MKEQKKSFLVLGLGSFGESVARSLASLGHEVLAMDADENAVQAVAPYVTQAVSGDVTDEETLKELGLEDFDGAIVAVGEDIRASVLVTALLRESPIPFILAKAYDDLHAKVLQKVGADRVVFPERDMGQRVARSLSTPNILDVMDLSGDTQIAEVLLPESWAGRTLVEVNVRRNYGLSVIGIRRGGNFIASPGADTAMQQGDVIIVMGSAEAISSIQS